MSFYHSEHWISLKGYKTYVEMEFLISAAVFVLVILGILTSIPFWAKCCKKCANNNPQPQVDSTRSNNVYYVNSVCLPSETNVEIPSNNRLPSYSVNNVLCEDMPPSYNELFGKI